MKYWTEIFNCNTHCSWARISVLIVKMDRISILILLGFENNLLNFRRDVARLISLLYYVLLFNLASVMNESEKVDADNFELELCFSQLHCFIIELYLYHELFTLLPTCIFDVIVFKYCSELINLIFTSTSFMPFDYCSVQIKHDNHHNIVFCDASES